MELKNVSKYYRMGQHKINALCGVNLKIREGEFLSILGPSGSGKSTLLHLLALLDKPSSGKIFIKGEDVTTFSSEKVAEIRNKEIGIVFQFFFLSSFLTAKENVELPMFFSETPKKERKKRSKELLKIVGLEKRSNNRPAQLSGGERQRIAIARALANKPLVILADEPTGNLDSRTGKEIIGIFEKLHRQGHTIVMVTHNEKIAKNSERIIYLFDGKIRKVVEKK